MSLMKAVTDVLSGARSTVDPRDLADRYGLSAAEMGVLLSLPATQLDLVRREVRAKRWDLLSVLPATTRALSQWEGGRQRDAYLTGTARPAGVIGRSGWLVAEAAHLVDWLHGHDLPPAVRELADFELLMLELAEDAAASEAALAAQAVPAAELHCRPVVAETVRFRVFRHDVVALAAGIPPALGSDPPAAPTRLVLQKRWPLRWPAVTRAGEAVVDLLGRCDGSRTARELAAAATDPDRTAASIATLLERAVLVPGGDDACASAR
jgi:hypothetical protein